MENGALAVELALAREFDLILMDMQMPVMGGMEAIGKLRAAGYRKPIAALTADAMDEDVQRYREVGCDEFLAKPINQRALSSVLAKYLAAGGHQAKASAN